MEAVTEGVELTGTNRLKAYFSRECFVVCVHCMVFV